MSLGFKFNYHEHYAKETEYSFSKYALNKGYCPNHPDVLIKKGFFKIKRNECWRCVQNYNQHSELCIDEKFEQIIEPIEQQINEPIEQQNIKPIEEQNIKPIEQQNIKPIEQQNIKPIEQQINETIEEQSSNISDYKLGIDDNEYEYEYQQIKNILFRFHYEIQGNTSQCYQTFKCKFCKDNYITREQFKVVCLGPRNNCGRKHIKNNLPVCMKCHSNWNIRENFKKTTKKEYYLLKEIKNREDYVKQFNLVSSDEIIFIYNYNIDKLFPIV